MKYLKYYNSKTDGDRALVETPFVGMAADQTPLVLGKTSRAHKVRLTVKDDILQIEDYTLPQLREIAVWLDEGYTTTNAMQTAVAEAIMDETATEKYDFNNDGRADISDVSELSTSVLNYILPYTGNLTLLEIKVLALVKQYGSQQAVISAMLYYLFHSSEYNYWLDLNNDGHVDVTDLSTFKTQYWYMFPGSAPADEEEEED